MLNYILFIISLFIGVVCDVISKQLSLNINTYQIVFFRFSFCALLLFFLFKIKFNLNELKNYFTRGIILFFAIFLWIIGLQKSSISNASFFGLLIPIITIQLAYYFLNDKLSLKQLLYSFLCFLITICYLLYKKYSLILNIKNDVFFIISVVLFSSAEIINKKYTNQNYIKDAFGVCCIVGIISFCAVIQQFKMPSISDFTILFLLGLLSAVMYYCLFRSYRYCRISIISSFRYFEIVIAVTIDYFLFEEVIDKLTLIMVISLIYCNIKIYKLTTI